MSPNGLALTSANSPSSPTPAAPYRKGWRAPWRGQWGPITDGNSKLGRLADRFERRLAAEYDTSRPAWADKVREAAELKAHAQRARALLGIDPKVTLRQITAATAVAERLLAKVERNGGQRAQHETGAELVERVNQEIERTLARERGDG